jgi:hypothetical protein
MSRPLFRGGSPPPYATDFYTHTHTRRTDARKQLKKKKSLDSADISMPGNPNKFVMRCREREKKRKRNKKQKIQPNEIQEEI